MIESGAPVLGRIGLLRDLTTAPRRTGIYLCKAGEYRACLKNSARAGLAVVVIADPAGNNAPFLARRAALTVPDVQDALNTAAFDAMHGNGAANVIDRVLQQPTDTR